MTHLVGGEIARDEQADEGQRDDRNALGEGRRRVAPAERPVVVGSERTAADARRRRDHHRESDHQHADQGVDAVGRCTRGPEDERREHHPDADSGRDPLQPLPAPVHAEEREYDDEARPTAISLIPRRVLRTAGSAISCPSAGGSGAVTGSNSPSVNGDVTSQSPSAALVIGAQSVNVRCCSTAASTSSSLRSSGALSRSAACSSSGCDAATTAGSELVLFVPIGRVCLQPPDHFRQRGDQAMPRLPTEQLPRARDVDLVVIVGVLDHPRLDVGVLVEHLRLDPCSGLGDALRQGERAPVLAVDEAPDAFLHLFVGRRLFLADQKDRLVGKLRAPIHGAHDGVDKIVLVQVRLSAADVAR